MTSRLKRILDLLERGLSYGNIARELGMSRSAVAGAIFRHRHPGEHVTGQGRRSPRCTGRRSDWVRAA